MIVPDGYKTVDEVFEIPKFPFFDQDRRIANMHYVTPHQTVILAGGKGTRLMEKTQDVPKPMIMLGDKPLLEHIIDIYSKQGFHEFIIPVGYRKEVVFQYFMDKFEYTYQMDTENKVLIGKYGNENLIIVDTGEDTQTGGRIKRIQPYMNNAPFMLTYGDGLGNVNLHSLSEQHRNTTHTVTLTAVHPLPRFGAIKFRPFSSEIMEFGEKQDNGGWVNGGFMVCEPTLFNMIDNSPDVNFESEVLPYLASVGELGGYRHESFWWAVDTLRDLQYLQELESQGYYEWLKITG